MARAESEEGRVGSMLDELVQQARDGLDGVPAQLADDLTGRFERWGPDLLDGLAVYGERAPVAEVVQLVTAAARARRPALVALDRARLLRPDWFAGPDQVGYVCYADRFAGTLRGVGEKLGYLRELGVSYLHLMPLLDPRDGPDDGGYAVRDYRTVRADLGTLDDLGRLADSLHAHGMALTLDLVLNHVAREHAWARAAVRGEEPYRSYFLMYPDRTAPDAYERTLPEVFPDFAPGSFSWVPDAVRPPGWGPSTGPDGVRAAGQAAGQQDDRGAWVWTTFNDYQWDLDWSNPAVFCELLSVILDLANVGVDVFRLDAIAFLWKQLGTACQGRPEVHQVVQALRAATRVAAPAVLFKAEAIVAPEDLPAYLGTGRHAGKVCDLAYHNSLMVQLWSALATGRADLARHALAVPPPKPVATAWGTYVRCHDDIGWAISDSDAGALGLSGHAHRRFLAEFYAGTFPGSFARGEVFQANPATGDARISGTLASLAGLESALEAADPAAIDLALGRIFLLHAVTYGYGGIPLLYMGDELGLRNDHSFLDDPALAADNRWLHRPRMDWAAAERRHDPGSIEGRVFAGLRHLARVRAGLPALHASVESEPVDLANGAVLGLRRRHPAGTLLGLYNVSPAWQRVAGTDVARLGVPRPWENLSSFAPRPEDGELVLPPYAAWWLTRSAR